MLTVNFLGVFVEYRAYEPEHKSGCKYRGKYRYEEQHNRSAPHEVDAEKSTDACRHYSDDNIHESNASSAQHTRCHKPFEEPDQGPYKPY